MSVSYYDGSAMERPDGLETLKLAAITAMWVALTKGLIRIGERVIPDAWKAKITLQTFLMACQVLTTALGLVLCFTLLARPRAVLAFARPRRREIIFTALLAPAFLISTTVLALQAAMPILLEELRTRGPGVSRQNAGELGRMLEQGPLVGTLLWGAILAAAAEELLFRGALWSLVDRIVKIVRAEFAGKLPRSRREGAEPGPMSWAERASPVILGLFPTIAAAAVFGLMHGDLSGGVGVVRLVSATLLGLGAGVLRWWTGTMLAPILLHFLNNMMVIGHGRKWFTLGPPGQALIDGVPNGLLGVAALGLLGVGLLWGLLAISDRRAARDRAFAEGARPS